MRFSFQVFGVVLFLSCLSAGPCAFAQSKGRSSGAYSFDHLPAVQAPVFKKDTFSILRYGAKADGRTLNTSSINTAITACSANGGGVVLIPGGLWLTGPVVLKNGVNLHLAPGAILLFTDDLSRYELAAGNWEGVPAMRNQSPVSGTNLQNIAITGSGIIDGNGDAWRPVKKDKLTESQWKKKVASGGVLSADAKTWYPSEGALKGSLASRPGVILPGTTNKDYEAVKDFLRPNLLVLTNCKKILLEGVTFQNSPAWNLHPLMCEDLTVRNVYAKNPWYAQNGDGIDVESCKNVLIEHSTFDVGDDGICVKSGRDEEGRKRGMPTENMIVRDCTVYHAHGGFVIGSEMSGGARNIFVSGCSFIGTDIGLRFKTTRGRGGIVEKIFVKDISMKDIAGEAILFDMYYAAVDPIALAGEKRAAPKEELVPVTEATPQFRDFFINNIVCSGADKAVFVRGLPEMSIKNIQLEGLMIQSRKGIDIQEAENVSLSNVQVISGDTDPVIYVHNGSNLSFRNITYSPGATQLIAVSGSRSKGIQLSHTDASGARKESSFVNGAQAGALNIK